MCYLALIAGTHGLSNAYASDSTNRKIIFRYIVLMGTLTGSSNLLVQPLNTAVKRRSSRLIMLKDEYLEKLHHRDKEKMPYSARQNTVAPYDPMRHQVSLK